MKNSRTFTVRLSHEEDRLLGETARLEGRPRLFVVRKAVARYCLQALNQPLRSPYEVIAHRIGCARSGRKDLSERTGASFRRMLKNRRPKASR